MCSRSPTPRRARARLSRAALVSVITVVGLLAVPGTAAANGQVTPFLNCTRLADDGSFTAVVGYDNTTGKDVTIPYGDENRIAPTKHDGAQPTVFRAGRQDGAFTITVSDSGTHWTLGGTRLWIRSSDAPACPPSTELPEEGNGTGPAIALVAAGLVGAALVHRARKRASALSVTGRRDA